MIAQEHVLARLNQLLEQGMLARSTCSRQFLAYIAPLVQSGIVIEERAGAGRRLTLVNPGALESFVRDRFPGAALAQDASSREAGIARFRDTKSFRSDTPEIVTVRAWSEAAFVSTEAAFGSSTVGQLAVRATADYGIFSFLTSGPACAGLRLSGCWALVENPIVFQRFERLGVPAHGVMYGRGRASKQLLDWIKQRANPDFRLVHLPDYDPAGLSEHERLRAHLGALVQLHTPGDLELKFAKLSNPGLLKHSRTKTMLAALRNSGDKAIQQVVQLIDRFNAGLEQEALLVQLEEGGSSESNPPQALL